VVKLLEKGADLEYKDDKNGRMPLSYAAERGHEAVVKLLLEKGAEQESKDNFCAYLTGVHLMGVYLTGVHQPGN
jgi:hypothetical protein